MRRSFPDDYPPINFCRGCGCDFSSVGAFDRHRIGTPSPADVAEMEEEMAEVGLALLTDEEMRGSRAYRSRVGFGVEVWHEPAQTERARSMGRRQQARSEPSEGTEAVGEGEDG